MEKFLKLKKIIKQLRSKDGCPWDRKQTHQSLLPFLYEEANEVGDTLINQDSAGLKEELGDLLLQIMLHSRIAEENGEFNIDDVIEVLNQKLVRRHPHVFGDKSVENSEQVKILWDDIKKKEKKNQDNASLLSDIPKHFAPLLKSYKIQKKVGKAGFEWDNPEGIFNKIEEELNEIKEAVKNKERDEIEHEIGDFIFAIVNLAKWYDVHADVALSKANLRFIKRFQYIEKKVNETGKKFSDFTLEELDFFWNEAKKQEMIKKG